MNGPFALAVLGFFLGMRHATDADHVIAVSTIVSRYRSASVALLIGAAWGVGHTLTVLVIGGGIVLFGWVIPPRLGLSFEFAVAVMLVVLGVANLRSLRQAVRGVVATRASDAPAHSHAHSHGDYVHTHPHAHRPESHPHTPDQTPLARLDRALGGARLYPLVRPLVIGVVHGLAGSAAVALLVLAAVREPVSAVIYLVLFGAGTILGMMVLTTVIAWPLATRSSARFAGGIRAAAGLVSLAFGCYLAYRVGVIDGLFR